MQSIVNQAKVPVSAKLLWCYKPKTAAQAHYLEVHLKYTLLRPLRVEGLGKRLGFKGAQTELFDFKKATELLCK